MISARDLLRHPSHLWSHAEHMLHPRHKSHGSEIGGLLMLVIGIGLFLWLFPELRRYIRISRM